MLIEIKNRFTNNVLFSCEANDVREAVVKAVKERVDLSGANLRGVDIRYADIRGAKLNGADFLGADLRYVDLRSADFRYADLRGADLRSANLQSAKLNDANIRGADLNDADFSGANLNDANFRGVDFRGLDFSGAKLLDANFQGEKIAIAPIFIYGLNTIWNITISESYLRIGCQHHTHAEWSKFDDDKIKSMHDKALEFWSVWKKPLLEICKNHRKLSLEYRKNNPGK